MHGDAHVQVGQKIQLMIPIHGVIAALKNRTPPWMIIVLLVQIGHVQLIKSIMAEVQFNSDSKISFALYPSYYIFHD